MSGIASLQRCLLWRAFLSAALFALAVSAAAVSAASEPTELTYAARAGVRMKRMFAMLASESTAPAIAIFMVVSEPGRALAFWFMKAAEGRESKGRPYVFELASPWTSPIVAAEQYWSAM